MRLSQMGGKEIVNLNTGERLGIIAETDLVIDEKTGKIISMLIPDDRVQFSFFGDKDYVEVEWKNVRKIGNDMIIIEQEESKRKKFF